MSLPYPSMVFVPLDILTAEEMNQLVANIESLSSGTGLADGAITSDKIDWTTYYYSTSEQLIGQYENKSLYRKAIVVPANSNTSISVDTGVAIDKLLNVSANMHVSTSNDDNWVGTFYGSATDFFRYFLRKYTSGATHSLEIRVGSGNATNSPDYIVILEYTK